MRFIHIREPDKTEDEWAMVASGVHGSKPVFRPRNGMTIAYEIAEKSRRASVGFSLCMATQKLSFSKRLGRKIASDRFLSNPIHLRVDGDLEFTPRLMITLLRGLLIERPEWTKMDHILVLKPTRFDSRWEAEWVGPDGSLASAEVDGKEMVKTLPSHIQQHVSPPRTWAMRIPRWSIEFATEHMA